MDEFIERLFTKFDEMIAVLERIADAMEEGIEMENEEINRKTGDKE
jgi:hypothetical protein